ncbi:LysR substrate-binding domain-containing protein [Vibrio salinus]|uniref:LysR substrate-binding domain-containing protein n=1 Tax=Vibrio salinus TaxID=2899784 RepID=UPI001E3F3D36|nr:LysR substrate-binding domain-containing protein [Vibrio salinus]MCE0494992.1 LysR substrate-binding domain-containing protein [Vibrio salinus]
MKETLPPLRWLYYFYVAAEHGSFKVASEQLFVTAAAISQQIRQLEEWLECELFIRQHRNVELTPEGDMLFDSVQKGFAHIQDGIRAINQDTTPNQLSISVQPTFAQYWLIPRIKHFRALHPHLSLMIDPTNKVVNFRDNPVDICIRHGVGNYKDCEAVWLMDEIIYPVCHKHYQQEKQLYDLSDLKNADLIEDISPDKNWTSWLQTMNQPVGKVSLKYEGSQFVMDGALASQGVALIKHSIAQRYIQDGQLVRIGNKAVKNHYSYYLCAPRSHMNREKIQTFIEWIQSEVQSVQQNDKEGINLLDLKPDKYGVIDL